MLTEDDIKEGVELVCIDTVDSQSFGNRNLKLTLGKTYTVLADLCFQDDKQLAGEYFGAYVLKNNFGSRLHMFKLKLKETNMLNPEIYAVGTVHKHTINKSKWRIIARNVKTNEFKSGVAMIVINNDYAKPVPFAVCQETGVFIDGYNSGLYVAPKKHKGWINIYDVKSKHDIGLFMYKSKEEAVNATGSLATDHIACIEIEYEEGQGL